MARSADEAVEQYSELACEHDKLRLYGVLQLEPQKVAKLFLIDDGHSHVLIHARIGYVEKWGSPAALLNNGANWKDVLRFNIAVVPTRRDPRNLVKLTLYSMASDHSASAGAIPQLGKPELLSEVGEAIFHLHDILRATDNGRISDNFLFWNEFQTVGELNLDVDFVYGEFGRGMSRRVLWGHPAAQAESREEKNDDEEAICDIAEAGCGTHTPPECSQADEIDESHIAKCFESLYLAAAVQDNEIKAARAGAARMRSFMHLHSQLPNREERLAFVRHQLEAPAMQLRQHSNAYSRTTDSQIHGENGRDPGQMHSDVDTNELPVLPSLLPL